MILNYDPSDCLTHEEEATFDAQADEAEVDDWLASWSDDFNSDEWLAAVLNPPYSKQGSSPDERR